MDGACSSGCRLYSTTLVEVPVDVGNTNSKLQLELPARDFGAFLMSGGSHLMAIRPAHTQKTHTITDLEVRLHDTPPQGNTKRMA